MLSGIACPISIIGNKSYCFTLGWLIISNFIKLPTTVCIVFLLEFAVLFVCFATVGAGVDVAGLVDCGAVEVSVLVWDWISVVGVVVCTLIGAVTGADWIVGAGVLID
jgi:hypothetical protein